MRRGLALLLLCVPLLLSAVVIPSGPDVWRRSGPMAVGGGWHPIDAGIPQNTGVAVVLIEANSQDILVDFDITCDAIDTFEYKIAPAAELASDLSHYEQLRGVALWWNETPDPYDVTAGFGRFADFWNPTSQGSFVAGSGGDEHEGLRHVLVPAGSDLMVWSPVGETNFGMAIQVGAPPTASTYTPEPLHAVANLHLNESNPTLYNAAEVVAGANGAHVKLVVAKNSPLDSFNGANYRLTDSTWGAGYTSTAARFEGDAVDSTVSYGTVTSSLIPLIGGADQDAAQMLATQPRPWVWLPPGQVLQLWSNNAGGGGGAWAPRIFVSEPASTGSCVFPWTWPCVQ